MSNEPARAQVVDWWSAERARVSRELEERLPLLLIEVDKVIDEMPLKAFVRRGRFQTRQIAPIVRKWIEAEYKRLSAEIDESFFAEVIGPGEHKSHEGWTTDELLTAGAATAFSIAPLAALPFVGGLLVSTGFLGLSATLAIIPATIVGAGLVMLGLGPSIRGWARRKLRETFRSRVRANIRTRIIGDLERLEIASLKGTIFTELDGFLSKRLGELE
ncbi:hypothetical protein SAMN04490248_11930 [Salinihabitans flavidus]|uniref:Uncharacterized protein n=1 Tax=Salinihabitans flavidus TaxID=569882 RepID=A0A1H8UBN8_9RHOB|nr:hypothetical protein [Salinihabitans flavidus]SEP00516.1 hypothetical protein SAMN04490248_11930 [Salinihabitans flavidus]